MAAIKKSKKTAEHIKVTHQRKSKIKKRILKADKEKIERDEQENG